MKIPEPHAEHRWLQRLVGEWTYEAECDMGPGQPPVKTNGRESVRALGPLWTVGEWTCESDDVRTLTSQVQGPDGQWTRFMSAQFQRQK